MSTLRLPHGAVARYACVGFRSFENIDEGASTRSLKRHACCRTASKVSCRTSRCDAIPQCVGLDSVTKSGSALTILAN